MHSVNDALHKLRQVGGSWTPQTSCAQYPEGVTRPGPRAKPIKPTFSCDIVYSANPMALRAC
jgi:hypothetical protein